MKRKHGRMFAWCLLFCMIFTQILFTDAAFSATRVEGSNVYQTAINIAKAGWKTSETAIITRGDEIADALAATPLAYAKGKAPILFTETNKLTNGVMDELVDLEVKTVYIIGGYGAVNYSVERTLSQKFGAENVIRLSGTTRVETALAVAKAAFPNGTDEVVISGAYTNADALSISSIAAVKGMPILLVDGMMTKEVADYVSGKKVYAVGGPGVLSDEAVSAAKAERLAGADRYGTNAAILKKFAADYSKVFLSKGDDAHSAVTLAASAMAALSDSPIVLVDESNSIDAVREILKDNVKDDTEVVAIGGTSVIPEKVISAVNDSESESSSNLDVQSVTAENLKQIYITFKSAVNDEDKEYEIEDERNYTIKDSDGDEVDDAVESVELQSDKMTAVLTLKDKNNASPLRNQEEYKLVLSEDILGEEKDIKFTPKDTSLPKSVGAEVIGINTIKVKFSEPMRADSIVDNVPQLNKESFEVDDGDIRVNRVELVKGNKEANVVLSSDLKDGQKLTIKVKSKAKDYAGYTTMAAVYNLKVDKDTKGPDVTGYKDVSRKKVTLIFNEDIVAKDDIKASDIYHTSKSNKHDPNKLKISGNEMTIEFNDDDKMPSGTVTIYISEGIIEDLWENENDDITEKITINEDNTKPKVKKVEQGEDTGKGMTTIVVKFNEDVDEDSAEDRENYVIEDSDGNEQSISKAELTESDEVTLTMKYELSFKEEYEITVKDVKDLEGNKMDEYNGKFKLDKEGSEYDWSNVVVGLYDAGEDKQRLVVDFGEPMTKGSDEYSVADSDKYILYIFPKGTTFPDGRPSKSYEKKLRISDWTDADIRVFDDDQKVEIKLPYDSRDEDTADLKDALDDNKVIRLVIDRVADRAGNTTDLAGSGYIKVEEDVKVSGINILELPVAIDVDKIQFTFEGYVDVDDDDIHVYYAKAFKGDDPDGAKEPYKKISISDIDTDDDDDGNTVVTIELDDELNYDATYTVSSKKRSVLVVTDGDGDTENEDGEKLEEGVYIVEDGIAPAIHEVKDSDGDYVDNVVAYITTNSKGYKESTVVIEMEELIDEFTLSKSTFDTEDFDIKEIYVTNRSNGSDDGSTEGRYIVLKLWEKEGRSDAKVEEQFRIVQNGSFKDISQNRVRGLKTEVYKVK